MISHSEFAFETTSKLLLVVTAVMRTFTYGFLLFVTCLATGERIPNYNQLGVDWMQKLYAASDSTPRASLRDFYDDSVLVYNGETLYGVDKIMEKYNNISTVVKRNITTADCSPTNDAGFIVNVFGKILFNVSENGTSQWFNEMLVFKPRVTAFYIQNQQFRTSRLPTSIETDVLRFV
jgi:Nuclear transport factor 2 (NTF2) domain